MYSAASTTLVIICVVLPLLDVIIVGLRFKVRRKARTAFGADDYIILLATVVQVASAAMTIYAAVDGGWGDSTIHILFNPVEAERYLKSLFIGLILFPTIVTMTKISALILFKKIFPVKSFCRACNIMMGLSVGWFLASVLAHVFSSNPVSEYWDAATGGIQIFDYPSFLISMAAINLVLDVSIVALPLFVIRTLQMTLKRKLLVSGMFLLGLFCIIASVVRLYYYVSLRQTPSQAAQIYTNAIIWTTIEPSTSIIAACLPMLAPLLRSSGNEKPRFSLRNLLSMLSFRSLISSKASKRTSESASSNGRDEKRAKEAWQQPNPTYCHVIEIHGGDVENQLSPQTRGVQPT